MTPQKYYIYCNNPIYLDRQIKICNSLIYRKIHILQDRHFIWVNNQLTHTFSIRYSRKFLAVVPISLAARILRVPILEFDRYNKFAI